ncbi:beta strand repeat-containing protein, partial [Rhodopirellula europaea]
TDNVGSTEALASLDIDGAAVTVDDVATTGTIDICGDTITTTGSLDADDAVITLIADDMNLFTDSGVSAAIDSGSADTIVLTKAVDQNIDLGTDSETDGAFGDNLGLSVAELQTFTNTAVLRIGATADGMSTQTEGIDVSDDVVLTNLSDLSLQTLGTVDAVANTTTTTLGSISVANLAVNAGGQVILDGINDVDTLAINAGVGTATAGDANITFLDSDGFTVGEVDTVQGVIALDGEITLTATTGDVVVTDVVNPTGSDSDVSATGDVTVTLSGDDAKLTVESGADITSSTGDIVITADEMDLAGSVTGAATDSLVVLQPASLGQEIDLGSTTAVDATNDDTLELSNDELNRVTAGFLHIGRNDAGTEAGDITITQAISFVAAMAPVVALITGGKIEDDDTNPGSIATEGDLALLAAAGVGTADPLDIAVDGKIAVLNSSATPTDVQLTSDQTITIDSVTINAVTPTATTISGISNENDGAIVVNTTFDGANIVVNQSVLTDGDITLNADFNGTGSGTDGGTIVVSDMAQIAGEGSTFAANTLANSITLVAEDDIEVSDLLAVNLVSVTSTVGSVVDDGVETTRLQGANITINAAMNIGGFTALTLDDVAGGNIQQAVDVNLTSPLGTLTATVPIGPTGGNVQINEIDGQDVTGDEQFVLSQLIANAGEGEQLAVLNSGGALLVDVPVTVTTHDLLIGTVDSGLLTISNTITLTDGTLDVGSQSGDVNVTANLSASEAVTLQTGNSDISINAGVESTGAGVVVNAGNDVTLGTASNVSALTAGQDITIDAQNNVSI